MKAQSMEIPQSGNLQILPLPDSLPTFITDHPDYLGEKVYIAALVSKMSKQIGENCKTTARVGPGGGRVAHASAHGSRIEGAEDFISPQPIHITEVKRKFTPMTMPVLLPLSTAAQMRLLVS